MRKLTIFTLALAFIFSLAVTSYAAEDTLTLSDAATQPDQTVYLTVTLNESIVGDTIGVSYTYDTSLLKAIPTSSSWAKKGVLQDFNSSNSGVWAVGTATDLKGSVCSLAFKVLPNTVFTETTVSCTVIVKKDAAEVGTFTAEATISLACDHNYGEWMNADFLGHKRVCSLCNAQLTQSHTWDEGTTTENPNDLHTNLLTFTCSVCGGTKTIEVSSEIPEKAPTAPATSPSSEPEFISPDTTPNTMPPMTDSAEAAPQPELPASPESPTIPRFPADTNEPPATSKPNDHHESNEEQHEPEQPDNTDGQTNSGNQINPGNQNSSNNQGSSGNQGSSANQSGSNNQENQDHDTKPYQDYNQPPQPIEESDPNHDGHSHSNNVEPGVQSTIPMIIPAAGNTEPTEHTHDHKHPVENVDREGQQINAVIAFGLIAAAVGAAVYFTKKKR